jgi:hypothetical protein
MILSLKSRELKVEIDNELFSPSLPMSLSKGFLNDD